MFAEDSDVCWRGYGIGLLGGWGVSKTKRCVVGSYSIDCLVRGSEVYVASVTVCNYEVLQDEERSRHNVTRAV